MVTCGNGGGADFFGVVEIAVAKQYTGVERCPFIKGAGRKPGDFGKAGDVA